MNNFSEATKTQLLRQQLSCEQEKHAQCELRLEPALELLERFMQLNFPLLHRQAKATGMELLEEAERALQALRTGKDLSKFRYDRAQPDQEACVEHASAEEQRTEKGIIQLSTEGLSILQILGSTADLDVVTIRWAKETGRLERTANAYSDLEQLAGLRAAFKQTLKQKRFEETLVHQKYVAAPAQLRKYQARYLIYLTANWGVPEYRTRFGTEPVHEAASVAGEALPAHAHAFIRPQTYPSAKCWWWTRVAKTLIELGGQYEGPFQYTVYDPVTDLLPAGFKRRYSYVEADESGSKPDLIVVMTPPGGKVVKVAVEFKHGKYSAGRIKHKICPKLRDYQHDFDGVYYLAPNIDAARKLNSGIKAAKKLPGIPPTGLLAVFRVAYLEGHWLPSPAQVDSFKTTPPHKYSRMAKNSGYYKHKPNRS